MFRHLCFVGVVCNSGEDSRQFADPGVTPSLRESVFCYVLDKKGVSQLRTALLFRQVVEL